MSDRVEHQVTHLHEIEGLRPYCDTCADRVEMEYLDDAGEYRGVCCNHVYYSEGLGQ